MISIKRSHSRSLENKYKACTGVLLYPNLKKYFINLRCQKHTLLDLYASAPLFFFNVFFLHKNVIVLNF